MRKPKILITILLCLALLSCKTPTVMTESHISNNTSQQVNTSRERDSIFVYIEKEIYRDGDTVYSKQIEYRDRWFTRVDTFFREVEVLVVDSVPYPVTVTETVKAVPNWVGWSLLGNALVIVAVGYLVWRRIRKISKQF